MCRGNAREETPESLVIACPARSGAEPYIALVVGGHDELGRLEARKESAGLREERVRALRLQSSERAACSAGRACE